MLQHVLIAAIVAAGFVLVTGPFFIPELHKLKFGQSIREEGPKSHQKKSGTPTMGGIMIILGITLGTLAAAPWTPEVLLAVFIMLGHFVLGFLDDYIKVVKKRNLGLKARQKLAGQILIAVVTMYVATQVLGIDTDIWIPGLDENVSLGALYYPLVLFVLVGTSNAVNLTDGLDGLAAGTVAIAASAFAVVSVLTGHGDLAYLCVAMAAACLAFLRFNAHPAKVFMGDTGSLALGGALAAVGILTHTEILLAVIGFVFVCEALSVIIQVISFQTTGKRVFRMSPIHHHFELGGWSEWKVVTVFWCVGLIASVAGLSLAAH
ncbi:MAG: phospho-N-acetylmuramoyl-pentapeptide-transferase [Selenomonadaceae bacterium]|jgi:phospho-N-acetylmuramoyl-pentapeptide-transferase|uniref:phospho-N-acetylmuramoyl-pentapeptide- transferase n=1 Tax=Selenomonas bovis TaxID=416586 RepID=UPI002A052976|nr:phospho-N-acetylmuramoyl-pentapeptide-transferase [Selenomonas sp.]MCI6171603.1 phospho-N-acetylmuramoyl-pentapeptide-transferase [Selenomonas bovis]MCI6751848.1 phospho-N-acetylmuramoyl-pentapeptide-transferase [Selenomonas bovis]MDY6271917.1 phospho-N-acetylmuramoyl-pentapeptide-transferase [Selenomonadaceae bacterium]MDY6298581.1 phospho-N-acetylmuramoyl-pentapeptide-transferase [Selenomonadaceae bacterium]